MVAALLVPEGQTVDVGTPIIAVDVPGAGRSPGGPPPAAPAAPAAVDPAAIAAAGPRPSSEDLVPPVPPPAERQAVLVGYGVKAGATTRRPRKAPSPAAPSSPAPFPGRAGAPAAAVPLRRL